MSDEKKRELPYKPLGSRLRQLRQKLQESLAEVSGAVEIDLTLLEHFEAGLNRPSRDILELLISHFGIKEDEARKLWKLAGYESNQETFQQTDQEDTAAASSVLVMPFDVRVAYTDVAHISANRYGVIINFMQSVGPNNQPLVVSRVGMSKEHALSVIEMLQKTLLQNEPKALPVASKKPGQRQKKRDNK